MTDPILKLQILARSEISLLRIQAKRNINQVILLLVALVFAMLALAMFNFAAYHALVETKSPDMAAMLVALGDIILVLGVVFFARSTGSNAEQEKVIQDIRDLAYNELSADFDEVKGSFSEMGEDVRRIRTGFNALTGASSGISNSLGPLIGVLIGALKKSK